jgi:hypothetical protein
MLRLREEEICLWRSRVESWSFVFVVASNRVIPARCERVVMARLESHFGAENDLIEPGWENHIPEGSYIAGTLVQDRREVPVRFLNTTCRDQT